MKIASRAGIDLSANQAHTPVKSCSCFKSESVFFFLFIRPPMAGQASQSPDGVLYSIWGPELRCWQRDEPNAPPPTWSHLWSNEQRLRAFFKDMPAAERRSVAQRCCQMALACGPTHVLAFLLDDGLVKPNVTFRPDNVTLLHLACLYRNADAVKLLANRYKVPWRRDSRRT